MTTRYTTRSQPTRQAATKGERDDLQRYIRQREKVLKSAAKQRSADMLADFENQMGQIYFPEDDPVWEQAEKIAREAAAKAQEQVAQRCRELGIPKDFAPSLDCDWRHRGYANSLSTRRTELRRMAQTQIAALEAKATTEIGLSSLEAQTELLGMGLTSSEAKGFVERLPKIEQLMPALTFEEVSGEANPPVAEQLVSSNALRQRRFRERQKVLRGNGSSVTPLREITDETDQ